MPEADPCPSCRTAAGSPALAARVTARQCCRVIEIDVLTEDEWPVWRELRLAALADAAYAFGSTLSAWHGRATATASGDGGHAITLYRRHGFEDTGELGDPMPEGVQREHVMAKPVSSG
jgi:hypothetical protein